MRILFIATASALFFAYVITELSLRLWPGDYFRLLITSFVALLLTGLLNLRLAGWLSDRRRPTKPIAPADGRPAAAPHRRQRPVRPAAAQAAGCPSLATERCHARNRDGQVVQPHQRLRLRDPRLR